MAHEDNTNPATPKVFTEPEKITHVKGKLRNAGLKKRSKTKTGKIRLVDLDQKPYKKTPPEDKNAEYHIHAGDKIPDPFRPLEDIPKQYSRDDERQKNPVQQWVNFQNTKTDQYIGRHKTREQLTQDLEAFWREDEPGHNDEPYEEISEYFVYEYHLKSNSNGFQAAQNKTEIKGSTYHLISDETGTSKITRVGNQTKKTKTLFERKGIEIDQAFISPNQDYVLCLREDSKKDNSTIAYVCNLKNDNTQEIQLHEEASFVAWHPSKNGFYYKAQIHKHPVSNKKKTIRAFFYHDVEQSEEEADKFILDLSGWKWDVRRTAIGQNTLSFFRRYQDKYRNKETQFLTDRTHPYKLVEVPPSNDRLDDRHIKIIDIDENHIYAALWSNIDTHDIIRLPLNAKNWDQAETIVKSLEMDNRHPPKQTHNCLMTIELENLAHMLRVYSLEGKKLFEWQPHNPSSLSIAVMNNKVQIKSSDYQCPLSVYNLNLDTFKISEIKKRRLSKHTQDFKIEREFATSKDGTEIPMVVLKHRNTKIDQNTPTIIHGYGGFGTCDSPKHESFVNYWVNRGGLYVITHPRGNGGWTKGWAEQGARHNQHNTFDDFNACAEHLITVKGISAKKLVSIGMSNGGLTVIAAMQKRKDLYGCVISQAPVLDMFNLVMDGKFIPKASWIKSFGVPEIKEDYEYLKTYSPLQNINPKVRYPPCLLMTCGEDQNAHPAHSLKFLATMQDRLPKMHRCYLYWKDKGEHSDIFKVTEDYKKKADFKAYADMLTFIHKCIL